MARDILVTGANRGIGLRFARQYVDAGERVVATARRPESATDLGATGAEVHALDVADEASVEALARTLSDRSFDLVVNNAGIYGARDAQSADRVDWDAWREVLDVNVLGPMRVARAFHGSLAADGGGKLVTISSRMGSIAENGGGHYAYRSSKAAVNCVMTGLAADWRDDGIVVLVLHPGWVRTDMGGENATLSPEESVEGMRAVIEGAGPADSGRFLDQDGSPLPW